MYAEFESKHALKEVKRKKKKKIIKRKKERKEVKKRKSKKRKFDGFPAQLYIIFLRQSM